MGLLNRLFYKNRKFYDDDFDWENYTGDSYARRIRQDIETEFAATDTGLRFDPSTGLAVSEGKPLHPNHSLIFEVIGRLAPASVHEVGCGGGDHLANGQILFPDIRFSGGDRGASQLEFALSRHPDLAGSLGLQDITMPLSSEWPRADLIYSQAVVMHIHTAVSHLVALSNMMALAERHVLFMENLQCHNFVADLRALHAGGHLGWDQLHLYRYDGKAGARALLASRSPVGGLQEVADDRALRDGLKPSPRRLKRSDEDSARGGFGFAPPAR